MATTNTVLPPMGKISMVGIWVETVLYGINCVTYGLCMSFLLRGGKISTPRWILLVMCTILFLLGTVHVGASLQQLLDAFIYAPADVPNYSTTYWLDYTTIPRILKDNLYVTLVLGQSFIIIWRLYVVFMCDWRVIIFPIILTVGCVGSVYAASAVSAVDDELDGSAMTSFIISGWACGFTLNVSVTGAIVARLWRMGREIASLTTISTNRFASSIYLIVESGVISAVSQTIVLALFVSSSPASLTGLDVISQLAVLTPLLIIVLAGQTGRCRNLQVDSSRTVPTAQDKITFRMEIPIPGDSERDPPFDTTRFRSPSSA